MESREKQYDMSPMNAEQMDAMGTIVVRSKEFVDWIVDTMKQTGLWDKGFKFEINVNPTYGYITKNVKFRRNIIVGSSIEEDWFETTEGEDSYVKGWHIDKTGTSEVYAHLLDGKEDASGTEEGKDPEKDLPADGLWVGSDDGDDPVDGGDEVNG